MQETRFPFAGQQLAPWTGILGRCPHCLFPLQVSTSSNPHSAGDEELQPPGKARGLRRSGQTGPRRHRRRGVVQKAARSPAVPQPSSTGWEESLPFVLDLQSLPGLANMDLSAQNPNIQVGSRSGWTTGGCEQAPHVLPRLKRRDYMSGVHVVAAICLLGNYQKQIASMDKLLAKGICSWPFHCPPTAHLCRAGANTPMGMISQFPRVVLVPVAG